ncbi:hypothetical protein GCM10010400_12390 [Streptomyces aculeolatus]
MPPSTLGGVSVLSPPPPPSIGQRAATWWARRHALGRMPFWLLTRAVWVLGPCTALFLLNGLLVGWVGAYEVLVGIASPADVDPGWAA